MGNIPLIDDLEAVCGSTPSFSPPGLALDSVRPGVHGACCPVSSRKSAGLCACGKHIIFPG